MRNPITNVVPIDPETGKETNVKTIKQFLKAKPSDVRKFMEEVLKTRSNQKKGSEAKPENTIPFLMNKWTELHEKFIGPIGNWDQGASANPSQSEQLKAIIAQVENAKKNFESWAENFSTPGNDGDSPMNVGAASPIHLRL